MIKKIANQCATFDGKGKLTVDDLYSVIKVQVRDYFLSSWQSIRARTSIHLFLMLSFWWLKFLISRIKHGKIFSAKWTWRRQMWGKLLQVFTVQCNVLFLLKSSFDSIPDLPMDKNYKINIEDFCKWEFWQKKQLKFHHRWYLFLQDPYPFWRCLYVNG